MARNQSFIDRAVKTLVYCPFEEDHADESPLTAWLLLICCIGVGIIASFDNVWWGVGLSVGSLYGAILVRLLIARIA